MNEEIHIEELKMRFNGLQERLLRLLHGRSALASAEDMPSEQRRSIAVQQNERLVSMLSNLDLSQIRASLKTLTSADTEPETSHQEKEVVPSKHGSGLRRSREAAAPESKRLALLSASKASERLQRSYTKKSQLELESRLQRLIELGEAQRRAQKPFEQAEEVQKKKADETLTLGNVNREEGRRSSIVNPYFHLLSATATTSTNISVSPMRRHSNPASPASHFILGNDISFKAPSKRATISPIPQHDPLTKISPLRRAENPFNIILKKEKTERKLN